MHFYHKLKTGLIAWLLVPLLALGGLQGQLCWCAHSPGGHGEAQPAHDHTGGDQASAHSDGRLASHDHGGEDHGETPSGSHEDCECLEIDGVQELAPASAEIEFRKPFLSGLTLVQAVAVGTPPEIDRAGGARSSKRVEHNHSPPLYVLNCAYLC